MVEVIVQDQDIEWARVIDGEYDGSREVELCFSQPIRIYCQYNMPQYQLSQPLPTHSQSFTLPTPQHDTIGEEESDASGEAGGTNVNTMLVNKDKAQHKEQATDHPVQVGPNI